MASTTFTSEKEGPVEPEEIITIRRPRDESESGAFDPHLALDPSSPTDNNNKISTNLTDPIPLLQQEKVRPALDLGEPSLENINHLHLHHPPIPHADEEKDSSHSDKFPPPPENMNHPPAENNLQHRKDDDDDDDSVVFLGTHLPEMTGPAPAKGNGAVEKKDGLVPPAQENRPEPETTTALLIHTANESVPPWFPAPLEPILDDGPDPEGPCSGKTTTRPLAFSSIPPPPAAAAAGLVGEEKKEAEPARPGPAAQLDGTPAHPLALQGEPFGDTWYRAEEKKHHHHHLDSPDVPEKNARQQQQQQQQQQPDQEMKENEHHHLFLQGEQSVGDGDGHPKDDYESLLTMAQFLTMVEDLYCMKKSTPLPAATNSKGRKDPSAAQQQILLEPKLGPITPQDVQQAWRYGQRLREVAQHQEALSMYDYYQYQSGVQEDHHDAANHSPGADSAEQQQQWKARKRARQQRLMKKDPVRDQLQKQWEERRSGLDGHTRAARIWELWERAQVGGTKALIQHVFLHADPTSASPSTLDATFCRVLNLPTNRYAVGRLVAKDVASPPPTAPRCRMAQEWHRLYPHRVNDTREQNGSTRTRPPPQPHPTLLLPPQIHTWREYARLATMAALFSSGPTAWTALHRSPLTGLDVTKVQKATGVKFAWTTADLVALWIRAQRNTQAARHLIQLFVMERTSNTTNSTTTDSFMLQETPMVVDESSVGGENALPALDYSTEPPGDRPPPKFRAVFQGNHKRTYKRVINESALVDALVTWAVMNQVLVTEYVLMQHAQDVMGDISYAPRFGSDQRGNTHNEPMDGQNGSKRRKLRHDKSQSQKDSSRSNRQPDTRTNLPSPSTRKAAKVDSADEQKLLFACQSYLLRLWARKHRAALTVLYYSSLEALENAKRLLWGQARSKRITEEQCVLEDMNIARDLFMKGVAESVKDQLFTSDRTFARIDRRITKGKFLRGAEHDEQSFCSGDDIDPFHETVHDLMNALKYSIDRLGGHKVRARLVAAKDDFDALYVQWFLRERKDAGLLSAAMKLIDSEITEGRPNTMCGAFGSDAQPSSNLANLTSLLKGLPAPWIDRCGICDETVLSDCDVNSVLRCSVCDSFFHGDCLGKRGEEMRSTSITTAITNYGPLRNLCKLRLPQNVAIPDFSDESSGVTWTTVDLNINRPIGVDGKALPYGFMIQTTEAAQTRFVKIMEGCPSLFDEPIDEWFPMIVPHEGSIVLNVSVDASSCASSSGVKVGDVLLTLEMTAFCEQEVGEKYAGKCFTLGDLTKAERTALFSVPATKIKLVVARPSKNIVLESAVWLQGVIRTNFTWQAALSANKMISCCNKCFTDTKECDADSTFREACFCRSVIRRLSLECASLNLINEDHIDLEAVQGMDVDDVTIESVHFKSVSLKRLDEMMKWIMNSGKHLGSSPFYIFGTRLRWASPGLESSPYELLCKGISLLTRSDTSMAIHLQAQFLQYFSAWCIPCKLEGNFRSSCPTRISLRLPFPCLLEFCSECRVRTVPTFAGGLCEQCTSSRNECRARRFRLDSLVHSFEERSSLVGSTVLLMPDDTALIETIQQLRRARIAVDHCERPIEFIVASYLPRSCEPEEIKSEGDYYLIPIVDQQQLQYLLDRCQIKGGNLPFHDNQLTKWRQDGVLNLEGIRKVSHSELVGMLEQTRQILQAITIEVTRQAQCTCSDVLEALHKSASDTLQDFDVGICGGLNCCQVKSHGTLGEVSESLTTLAPSLFLSTLLIESLLLASEPLHLRFFPVPPTNNELGGDPSAVGSSVPTKPMLEFNHALPFVDFLKRLQPIELNEAVPTGYRLIYSDILLDKIPKTPLLQLTEISARSRSLKDSVELSVALQRDDGDCLLWGLKLVASLNDNEVRVAAVLADSPSHRAGVELGDVVSLINGVSPSTLRTVGALYSALLCLPFCVNLTASHGTALATVLKYADGRNANPGSIVLKIRRDIFAKDTAKGGPVRVNSNVPITTGNPLASAPILGQRDRHPRRFQVEKTIAGQIQAEKPIAGPLQVEEPIAAPLQVGNPIAAPIQVENPIAAPIQVENPIAAPLHVGRLYTLADIPYYIELKCSFPRRDLNMDDLYMPGIEGTVLSLAETATLLRAIAEGHPMCGVRMMCPRYDVAMVISDLHKLAKSQSIYRVPNLPSDLWAVLARKDYQRSVTESGPACFVDKFFSYRMPTMKFPIDRIIEAKMPLLSRNVALSARASGFGRFGVETRLPSAAQQHSVDRETLTSQTDDIDYLDPLFCLGWKSEEAERIRGGGDDLQVNHDSLTKSKIVLSSLPRSNWHGVLVSSLCLTTLAEQTHGRALLTGYVQISESHDFASTQQHQVPVEVFYISNVGILTETKTYMFNPTQLWLVDADSEEYRYAETWKKQTQKTTSVDCVAEKVSINTSMSLNMEITQPTTDVRSKLISATRPQGLSGFALMPSKVNEATEENQSSVNPNIHLDHESFSLIESSTFLGSLPDGRKLYWYQSDPKALYLSALSWYWKADPVSHSLCDTAEREYLLGVFYRTPGAESRCQLPDLHPCIWGCFARDEVGLEPLKFASREALRLHIECRHTYGTRVSSNMFRVPEGHAVQKLAKDVVKAASCVSADKGRVKTLADCYSWSQGLMVVATTILKYFDTKGQFRNHHENPAMETITEKSQQEKPIAGATHCPGDWCHVCDVANESILLESGQNGFFRGLGCSLIGTVCLGKAEQAPQTLIEPEGSLGRAKQLLLCVADRVVQSRDVEPRPAHKNSHHDSCALQTSLRQVIWSDNMLDRWRSFVMGTRRFRALVQAFLILVTSIDTRKLPGWWKNVSSGWSKPYSIMGLESESALLLHLYTLDLALTESMVHGDFKARNSFASITLKEFEGLSYDEMASKALAWAKELDMPVYEGEYEEFCYLCQDGGDLLCCELCGSVCHQSCAALSSTPENFVCVTCMKACVDMHLQEIRPTKRPKRTPRNDDEEYQLSQNPSEQTSDDDDDDEDYQLSQNPTAQSSRDDDDDEDYL